MERANSLHYTIEELSSIDKKMLAHSRNLTYATSLTPNAVWFTGLNHAIADF
jgi:hypothetical protein